MILHILWLSALVWSLSKCEPPVSSYLPPGGGSGGRPSSEYGPPGRIGGNGGSTGPGGEGRLIGGNKLNQPQDSYLPPGQSGSSPDTQYGPPLGRGNQGPQKSQFGSTSQNGFGQGNGGNTPSSQYGTPGQNNRPGSSQQPSGQTPFGGSSRPQSSYGPPNTNQGFNSPSSRRGNGGLSANNERQGQRPETSYGPPPTGGIQAPGSGFSGRLDSQMPESSYLSPTSGSAQGGFGGRQPSSGTPSSSYGMPGFGGSEAGGRGFSNVNQGSGFGEDDFDEPAKYEFSYDVDDPQTGTKFHHSEQRDGDVATGEYNVELPDGRKQVVEYEAGLQGYKPQIRYEGENGGAGSGFGSGGGRGFQGGSQGYPRDGPGDSFQGGNNDIGPQGGARGQDGRPSRFEQGDDFDQGGPSQLRGQDSMGYSRGGPGNGGNVKGVRGYPSGRQRQGGRDQPSFGRSGSNGLDSFNPGSQNGEEGYPSGRPQGGDRNRDQGKGQGFSGSQGGGGGYPSGGPQGGRSGGSGGDNGYLSGGPNGPRGSGY